MKNERPVVSVVMITYGHENYIEEAIKGIFIQQTTFNFELIIADDCSPDRTEEVIEMLLRKTPENITVRYTKHKTNKGMMPNFVWALEHTHGKYIALCEGDDYWTDPLKLQKQVEFLEVNPECSMVFTNAQVKLEGDKKEVNSDRGLEELKGDRYYSDTEILESWFIPTASVIFRNNFPYYSLRTILENENFIYGDIVLFLFLAKKGKIFGLCNTAVVYRRHQGGVTNIDKSIEFDFIYYKHLEEIIKVFGSYLKTKKIRHILSKLELSLALHNLKSRHIGKGLGYLTRSVLNDHRPFTEYVKGKK